jgi:hypothetical protein
MFIRRLREEYYIWHDSHPIVPVSETPGNMSLVLHPIGSAATNGHTSCNKPLVLNKNVKVQCNASTVESVPLSPFKIEGLQDPS